MKASGDRLAELMDPHQRRPIDGRLSCGLFWRLERGSAKKRGNLTAEGCNTTVNKTDG